MSWKWVTTLKGGKVNNWKMSSKSVTALLGKN